MPEGAAPDGSGVPVLAVFRVKNGTLARILKFTRSTGAVGTGILTPKTAPPETCADAGAQVTAGTPDPAENFPRGSASHLTDRTPRPHT